jgi:Putative DNA-binding domain
MPFNPFDKPIHENLTPSDLEKLIERRVGEGYFIEFKSEFPSNQKIGHGIASFANTYGGWYIVGVKTNAQHEASEICGFTIGKDEDPIMKVRDIAKTHIDPVPVLYPQAVVLDSNQVVLVVYIPGDQDTPFVSKDGRIYRRIHDSSEPVPETNRYAIDRLAGAGKERKKQYAKFCSDERTFSKSESQDGWVKIFLSPYPFGITDKPKIISVEAIETLMTRSKSLLRVPFHETIWFDGNLPFNLAQTTTQSIIVRQIEPTKAAFNSLTAEFFINGRAKFFIPLRYLESFQRNGIDALNSVKTKQVLADLWGRDKSLDLYHLRFFDIGLLWVVVAYLVAFYQDWLGKESSVTDLEVAMRIEEVWRSVPFADVDGWGNHVERFGLPVVNVDPISVPGDLERGGMLLPRGDTLLLSICAMLALAFGFPPETYSSILIEAMQKNAKSV